MRIAQLPTSNYGEGGGVQLQASSAESITTLKNRESIHFGFLLRGFVEKESIQDTWIDSSLYVDT